MRLSLPRHRGIAWAVLTSAEEYAPRAAAA
jgi:hypothetical protein